MLLGARCVLFRYGGFVSYYGISAVKINANGIEVDEVLLHKFSRDEKAGTLGLGSGKATSGLYQLIRK